MASAEIQICRTGVFGVMTKFAGRFFKHHVENPVLLLHFKARFVFLFARNQVLFQLSSDFSAARRNSSSSCMAPV